MHGCGSFVLLTCGQLLPFFACIQSRRHSSWYKRGQPHVSRHDVFDERGSRQIMHTPFSHSAALRSAPSSATTASRAFTRSMPSKKSTEKSRASSASRHGTGSAPESWKRGFTLPYISIHFQFTEAVPSMLR